MVEIEDYNPFVIGLKLNPEIPLDNLMKKMKHILGANGFTVPLENEQQIGLQIKFGLPVESLGIKDNVEIQLNLQKQSFNVIGETPEEVMPIFEIFYGLLPELRYNDIEELIPFYEIVADAGIKTDNPPLNTLNESVPNLDLEDLKEMNSDLSVIGI